MDDDGLNSSPLLHTYLIPYGLQTTDNSSKSEVILDSSGNCRMCPHDGWLGSVCKCKAGKIIFGDVLSEYYSSREDMPLCTITDED